jgi:glycosyltransferase involved in cell wall biosynthesis
VSVIIPCFNYGRFLGDAIDSALSQTYQNLEIIVVNDASTDDTKEVMEHYEHLITGINKEVNEGVAEARNTGIRNSKGSWIICLDADDKLDPTYVDRGLQMGDAGADIVGTGQQEFGLSSGTFIPKPDPEHEDFLRSNQINCSSMFRREVWERVGGWHRRFSGYEDWEFWLKATKLGFVVKTIPALLYLYRKHGPSMIDTVQGRHDEFKAGIIAEVQRMNLYS